MTGGDWSKVFKQIEHKPAERYRFLKHSKPKKREFGIAARRCKLCWKTGSHIRKYGLSVCRQCFREIAKEVGFRKYG